MKTAAVAGHIFRLHVMKRTLLTLSLVLMTVSVTAPFWSRWLLKIPPMHWIRGQVKGEFSDHPWAGTSISVGDERSILKADGKFDFTVPPGVYVVRVCCSERFEPIRRDVKIAESDLYLELQLEPLLEIRGRLIVPQDKEMRNFVSVSARRIYTNIVKTAVVSATGEFSLRLSRGDWKVSLENPNPGLVLKAITFNEKELQEQTLTVSDPVGAKVLAVVLQ